MESVGEAFVVDAVLVDRISTVRADAGGSVEPVADREAEARQQVLAVEVVGLGQRDDGFDRVVDTDSAVGRIDVPHQFDTGLKIISQLASHLGLGIASTQHFYGQ